MKDEIKQAARLLASLGASKGGSQAAKNMTKKARLARAVKANKARWKNHKRK